MRNTGITTVISNLLAWLRGHKKRKRYADRPQWLQDEIVAKAAERRSMRNAERLKAAKAGGLVMMVRRGRIK